VEVEEKTISLSTTKPGSLEKFIDRDMMHGKMPFKL
jgi:hypothetical protein